MIDKTKAIGFLLAAFGGFVALTALLLLIKTQPALPKLESTRLPRLFVIQSGSMSPALTPASLALVFPTPLQKRLLSPLTSTPNYFPGDIISYRTGRQVITHRVISVNDSTLPVTYQTQGDANAAPDPNPVSEGQILGRTVFAIPYLGYLAGFAQKPSGFIFLVIVPATIIIYEELKSIKKLLPLPRANPKTALFIPLLGTALIFTAFSGAFFSNREASSGNSFQAAAVFATPTPTPQLADHLVINEVYYDNDLVHQIQSASKSEWVEFYNPTSSAIGVSGWSISDGNSCDPIATTTGIPAFTFAILTPATEAEFRLFWPSVPPSTLFITHTSPNIGSGLNNPGDAITLRSAACSTSIPPVDAMSYGNDTTYFSLTPAQNGHSWEREPDGYDTDTATDFVDRSDPSPGS